MKKVLLAKNFMKTVPLEKRKLVKRILKSIEQQLCKSDRGIFGTTIASQTRKFHDKNHLFKFRANSGDRIMFTYTKYLNGYREEDEDGIYLIAYEHHDNQARASHEYDEGIVRNLMPSAELIQDASNTTANVNINDISLEDADSDDMQKYEQYLNLEDTIIYMVKEDELGKLLDEGYDFADVYITDIQYEKVAAAGPMLLTGGAGSGKTLVCIHKLNVFSNGNGKTGYFTFTKGLKTRAEQLYKKISDVDKSSSTKGYNRNNDIGSNDKINNKNVSFYTLKDYCLKFLSISETKYVDFSWFEDNYNIFSWGYRNLDQISALDVWTEIRGIIKGYMWNNWARDFPFNFDQIQQISRDILENKFKYIMTYKEDPRLLYCTDLSDGQRKNIYDAIKNDDSLLEDDKSLILNDINKIYDISKKFEYTENEENELNSRDKRLMPLDMYLGLSGEVSIYNEEERRNIYSICLSYQKELDKNKYYDDNDLAGICIEKVLGSMQYKEVCGKYELDKKLQDYIFDYIVVDEVQDMTELQIFLLYSISNNMNKRNIMLAGDVHQIINPTYFNDERIHSLFFKNDFMLSKDSLMRNFRSQKNIVDLSNRLSEIRRKYIAKKDEKSEQLEEAINAGEPIFLLESKEDNLSRTINVLNHKANAAIIVADDEDRATLENLLEEEANNIYTIQEIKGLEFDYVFCYNLISKYEECWDDIFNNKARKNARYRYYFNIFYVAITRARKYLCLYEDNMLDNLYQEIEKFIEEIKDFDEDNLWLTNDDMGTEDWRRRAEKLEEACNYAKAIAAYKKSKADVKNIFRCEAKKLWAEKKYDEAIDRMLEAEEYIIAMEYAKEYAQDFGDDSKYIIAGVISGTADFDELTQKKGKKYMSNLIAELLLNEKYSKKTMFNYIENYRLLKMLDDCDKINTNINKML